MGGAAKVKLGKARAIAAPAVVSATSSTTTNFNINMVARGAKVGVSPLASDNARSFRKRILDAEKLASPAPASLTATPAAVAATTAALRAATAATVAHPVVAAVPGPAVGGTTIALPLRADSITTFLTPSPHRDGAVQVLQALHQQASPATPSSQLPCSWPPLIGTCKEKAKGPGNCTRCDFAAAPVAALVKPVKDASTAAFKLRLN